MIAVDIYSIGGNRLIGVFYVNIENVIALAQRHGFGDYRMYAVYISTKHPSAVVRNRNVIYKKYET